MAIYEGREFAYEHLLDVAGHVAQAAYHAPQITGQVEMKVNVYTKEDCWFMAEVMNEVATVFSYAKITAEALQRFVESGWGPVLVAVGADVTQSECGYDCGACGFKTCTEFNKYSREHRGKGVLWGGPSCNWKMIDYSSACTYAAEMANKMGVENRVEAVSASLLQAVGYMPECSVLNCINMGPMMDLWWYSRQAVHFQYEEWRQLIYASVSLSIAMISFPGTGVPLMKYDQDWWSKPMYSHIHEHPELMKKQQQVNEKVTEIVIRSRKYIAEKEKEKKKVKG